MTTPSRDEMRPRHDASTAFMRACGRSRMELDIYARQFGTYLANKLPDYGEIRYVLGTPNVPDDSLVDGVFIVTADAFYTPVGIKNARVTNIGAVPARYRRHDMPIGTYHEFYPDAHIAWAGTEGTITEIGPCKTPENMPAFIRLQAAIERNTFYGLGP